MVVPAANILQMSLVGLIETHFQTSHTDLASRPPILHDGSDSNSNYNNNTYFGTNIELDLFPLPHNFPWG